MEGNMNNTPDNIIEVKDAYKSYISGYSTLYNKKTVVLKGLNMTVQRGSIYALLGPSGCGKTTLLKSILGRCHLDAGEINVKIQDRSNVGYMPQDIGLVNEITIKETLNYYGWIYGVRGDKLEERKKILFSFLDITTEHSRIMELSGGQQRRISLCIALLHNPELLILDEPTVGIDPIINYNIWQYLIKLSTIEKKTIILTTHYIEEARQTNKVGMMRGGVLVLEGEAQTLMNRHGCNTLEEVFVKQCYIQDSERPDNHDDLIENELKSSLKPKLPLDDRKLISWNCFIGYFLKNFYYSKYGSFGWYLLFFIPLSTCTMYQYSLGRKPRDLTLGIINDELLLRHGNCEHFSNLTCFPAFCGFLPLLENENIIPVLYNDTRTALEKVNRNKLYGVIHISENFTESLQERFYRGLSTPEDVVEQSEINVWLGNSNIIIGDYLRLSIHKSYFAYLNKLSETCQWPVNYAKLPIKFNEPVHGNNEAEFIEFSIPGILLLLEFFLPVANALPIMEDKRSGIIERSLISGLTNLEIMASYAAITMLLFFMQTACNVMILYGYYAHIFEGSIILALSLLTILGFNGTCFGIFVAVFCDSIVSATFIVMAFLIGDCIVCGMFWSPEGMHFLLKSVQWFIPMSLVSESYRAIAIRAWTITHPVVYAGFLSVIMWTSVFIFATYCVIKFKRGRGH